MHPTTSPLDTISVAKPCKANWNEMTGDERVRNCEPCKLDVYDLSAMRREEAEAFVSARLGQERTCIRFFRRADGTLLTQDCPVGLRAAWKRVRWAAAALLAGGFATAAMLAPRGHGGRPTMTPMRQIYDFAQTPFGTPPVASPVMGDFAPPCQPPDEDPAPIMGKLAAPDPREVKGEMYLPPPK